MKHFAIEFKDEFGRAFCHSAADYLSVRQFRRNILSTRFCSTYVFPALVSILIFMAFVWGASLGVTDDKIIFFITLYAFWVGLFGSCQIINREVSSGEWAYWVLGYRRSFTIHFFASFLSSFLVSLIQVSVFAIGLILLVSIFNEPFFGIYTSFGMRDSFKTAMGIYSLRMPLFALSLFLAVVSGSGFGVLLSTIFKEPANSLKASVAFIVLVLIASDTVLNQGDRNSCSPTFAPIYLVLKAPARSFSDYCTMLTEKRKQEARPAANKHAWQNANITLRGSYILSDIAYILPQRYFFNVAQIFNKRVLKSDCDDIPLCTCQKCISDNTLEEINLQLKFLNSEGIRAASEKMKKPFWLFIAKILSGEVIALFSLFAICMAISLVFLYKNKKYYELR